MIDIGPPNILETPGNWPQNLDWVCALFTFTMAGVQPCRNGQDDKHEGTAEC